MVECFPPAARPRAHRARTGPNPPTSRSGPRSLHSICPTSAPRRPPRGSIRSTRLS